jgi:hypothetical protein
MWIRTVGLALLAAGVAGPVTHLPAPIARVAGDMLATQSAVARVPFVDLRDATVGHDMCAAPSARFYEPLVPASGDVIYHPDARGMAAIAGLVLDAVPGADQSRGSSR